MKIIYLLFTFCYLLNTNAQTVTTFAGSTVGFNDGAATIAKFNYPRGLAVATDGTVYVADTGNNCIRKISVEGVVSTLAGNGIKGFADGLGTSAQFSSPWGLAVAADGTVYVTEIYDNRIRKITADGLVTTLSESTFGFTDGLVSIAQFNQPADLSIDADGTLFIADTYNNSIRKITTDNMVTTLVGGTMGFGNGIGTSARFHYPQGISVASDGTIFVVDTGNHSIRKISVEGMVTTLAGQWFPGSADGPGASALFKSPSDLTVANDGTVFVADHANHRIRRITVDGYVSTLIGNSEGFADGQGIEVKFNDPQGIAVSSDGALFISDTYNHRIRKITGNLATANFQLENQVSVYPNPTSSLINLELDAVIAIKITIFDMNGRALQSKNILDNKNTIDISNLANGIYLMQITTSKGTIYKKIVKK